MLRREKVIISEHLGIKENTVARTYFISRIVLYQG